jgi:hypothetical protein
MREVQYRTKGELCGIELFNESDLGVGGLFCLVALIDADVKVLSSESLEAKYSGQAGSSTLFFSTVRKQSANFCTFLHISDHALALTSLALNNPVARRRAQFLLARHLSRSHNWFKKKPYGCGY